MDGAAQLASGNAEIAFNWSGEPADLQHGDRYYDACARALARSLSTAGGVNVLV